MKGAMNRLSTRGSGVAGGFSRLSSRRQDQVYSQAASPVTASLGGQEISLDPPFYDPQLSASKEREMEVGQTKGERRGQKNATSLGRT